MSLAEKINNDIKISMLARDTKKLETLRAIKAGLLLLKTGKDMSSGEIPETVEMQLLQKLVKQRKESAAIYTEQNRDDMAKDELYQADIIETYLPKQMGDDELKEILQEIITQTGASSMKDMGKVMGMASKKIAGKADNKKISQFVRDILQ